MTRFADPTATSRLVLGPCECPGTPHDEDWIELRTQLGGAEWSKVLGGDSVDLLAAVAVAWNLLETDGSEAPVDRDHVDRMFQDNFGPFNKWAEENLRITTTLPNASGGRSVTGSRATASRTPKSPTTR